jgi:hypothetical protein
VKGTSLAGTNDAMLTPLVEESFTPKGTIGGESESKYVCAICLSSIWTKKYGTCDPCGHVLHQSCFCEWAMARKAFFIHNQEQQQTKCPVCNTGVHQMQNIYWTSSSSSSSSSREDIDEEKIEGEENSDDCSYFNYLEQRVQEATAAIKLRISLLEEQRKSEENRVEGLSKTVEVLKHKIETLTEEIEQNRLDLNGVRETMEKVIVKFGLTGMLQSGTVTTGESDKVK